MMIGLYHGEFKIRVNRAVNIGPVSRWFDQKAHQAEESVSNPVHRRVQQYTPLTIGNTAKQFGDTPHLVNIFNVNDGWWWCAVREEMYTTYAKWLLCLSRWLPTRCRIRGCPYMISYHQNETGRRVPLCRCSKFIHHIIMFSHTLRIVCCKV